MINAQLLSVILLILAPMTSYAMVNQKDFHTIIIPGQNDLGGEHGSVTPNGVIPLYILNNPIVVTESYTRYTTLNTPRSQQRGLPKEKPVDLGQKNCTADFERQFNQDPHKNKKNIFYASSQGTATLVSDPTTA